VRWVKRIAVLALLSGIASVRGDELVVSQSNGATTLTLGSGQPFHSSSDTVVGIESIDIPGSPGTVVLWREVGLDAVGTAFYAISLDGVGIDTVRETGYELELVYTRFDPGVEEPVIVPSLLASSDTEMHLVQLIAQPLPEFRAALESLGATIYHFAPKHAYLARVPPASRDAIEALPLVRVVVPFHPAYKLEESLIAERAAGVSAAATRTYSIMLMEPGEETQKRVAARIMELGGCTHGIQPGNIRLFATLTMDQLAELVHMDDVLFVDVPGEIEYAMNNVREISGANYVESVGSFRGQGVRGEAWDTGLRTSHVDFQHHPALIHVGNSVSTDHGTPVYGIIFGDGTGNATARGVLPEGQGIFASSYVNDISGPCGTYPALSNRYKHTSQLVRPDDCPTNPTIRTVRTVPFFRLTAGFGERSRFLRPVIQQRRPRSITFCSIWTSSCARRWPTRAPRTWQPTHLPRTW
jgi:hypothetical protein